MKRLAFISGLQIYPPTSGGQLRSAGLAAALARQGFQVDVHSLVGRSPEYRAGRPSESVQVAPQLSEYIDRRRVQAAVQFLSYRLDLPPLWIEPWLRWRISPELQGCLDAADAVIADFPFLAQVFRHTGKPRVLNTHNIEHQLIPAGGLGSVVRERVRRIEMAAVQAADLVCCCSQQEADAFSAAGAKSVRLVSNGIDVTRFDAARTRREAMRQELGVGPDETLVIFPAGRFGPNREAFEWLLAQARRHEERLRALGVHFVVVGSVVNDPQRTAVLTATGRVERVEPYFAAADFAINPMFSGAGTNVKMADFIAARLPILTTVFGARGFELVRDHSALVFEAQSLLPTLEEALSLGESRRREMAEAAFVANAATIDIDRCVQPLVSWLQERI